MVPVISISGRSGSGKTTLIVKLVSELIRRGFCVGTLKHDAHGFEIDHEGKDSWKHKQAGAATVALSSRAKFAVIKDVEKEWTPGHLVNAFFHDMDVVILEGYKKNPFPRIEVVRAACSKRPVAPRDSHLLAYVSDTAMKTTRPVFGLNQTRRIASFIVREVVKKHRPTDVSLTVDGTAVELDPKAAATLGTAIRDSLKGIKGTHKAQEIALRLKLK